MLKSESAQSGCFSEDYLNDYINGVISEADATTLELHLSGCEACRQMLMSVVDNSLPPSWLSLGKPSPAEDVAPVGHLSARQTSGGDISDTPSGTIRGTVPIPPLPTGFVPVRRLGGGGTGEVWEVRDTILQRSVALKFLRYANPTIDDIQRLMHEAQALGRLQHPGIVRILEVTAKEQPAILMELIGGSSLAETCNGRVLQDRDAAQIMIDLAEAIQHAHSHGVIHRDLKPSNILLQLRPEFQVKQVADELPIAAYRPMVTDFGTARLTDSSGITCHGQLLGTPAYMAPEQVSGDPQAITEAVDIYSLGVILYELLTGRPPYVAHSAEATLQLIRESEPLAPRELQPLISRDLENICLKCLSRLPRDRYASALLLKDDLQRFLESRPVMARPLSRFHRAVRWYHRNRVFSIVLSAVVVLLLAITAQSTWFGAQQQKLKLEADGAAQEAQHARNTLDAQLIRTVRAFDEMIQVFGNLDTHDQTISPAAEMVVFEKSVQFFRDYMKFRDEQGTRSPADLEIALRLYWLEEMLKPGSGNDADLKWISDSLRLRTAGDQSVGSLDLQARVDELVAMNHVANGDHLEAAAAWRRVADNIAKQVELKNLTGEPLHRHHRLRAAVVMNTAAQFLATEDFSAATVAVREAIDIINGIPKDAEGSELDAIRTIEYSMTLAQLLHADRKTSRAVATIEGALALCRNSQSPDPRQQIMLANLQQRLHKLRADITGESVLQ
jgi:serine/threonine protein kinase